MGMCFGELVDEVLVIVVVDEDEDEEEEEESLAPSPKDQLGSTVLVWWKTEAVFQLERDASTCLKSGWELRPRPGDVVICLRCGGLMRGTREQ